MIAILDCARVLSALERMRSRMDPETGMISGEGSADGHLIRDDSLPDLLYHGTKLLDKLRKRSSEVLREVRKPSDKAG